MEYRARVEDREKVLEILERGQARRVQEYVLEDRVYFLQGHTNLERGYVRIRKEEGKPGYIIQQKRTHEGMLVETSKSHAPDLFNAKQRIQGHWLACIVARKGIMYEWNGLHVHVEAIEEFGDSIEIVGKNENAILDAFYQLGATDIWNAHQRSLPLQFMIAKNQKKPL